MEIFSPVIRKYLLFFKIQHVTKNICPRNLFDNFFYSLITSARQTILKKNFSDSLKFKRWLSHVSLQSPYNLGVLKDIQQLIAEKAIHFQLFFINIEIQTAVRRSLAS